MSDMFDHECDAFDRMANGEGDTGEGEEERGGNRFFGWYCDCGRWHPDAQETCWWCKPPQTKERPVNFTVRETRRL